MFDYTELEEELRDICRECLIQEELGQNSLMTVYWSSYIDNCHDENQINNCFYQFAKKIYQQYPELQQEDFYVKVWW